MNQSYSDFLNKRFDRLIYEDNGDENPTTNSPPPKSPPKSQDEEISQLQYWVNWLGLGYSQLGHFYDVKWVNENGDLSNCGFWIIKDIGGDKHHQYLGNDFVTALTALIDLYLPIDGVLPEAYLPDAVKEFLDRRS